MITIFQGQVLNPAFDASALKQDEVQSLYHRGKPHGQHLWVDIVSENGTAKALFTQNGKYSFDTQKGKIDINVTEILSELHPRNEWTVCFPENSGAPEQITLKELKSLHLNGDFGVRHFSGTAVYTTAITVPEQYFQPHRRLTLDLGNVAFFAEVWVNGESAGTLWKPPFAADVTDMLRAGENRLEVRVTSVWTNRLIGDEYLPVENQYDNWGQIAELPQWYKSGQNKDGKRTTFVTWKQYDKNGPLTESGLIGPVKIYMSVEKSL